RVDDTQERPSIRAGELPMGVPHDLLVVVTRPRSSPAGRGWRKAAAIDDPLESTRLQKAAHLVELEIPAVHEDRVVADLGQDLAQRSPANQIGAGPSEDSPQRLVREG